MDYLHGVVDGRSVQMERGFFRALPLTWYPNPRLGPAHQGCHILQQLRLACEARGDKR